jgi:hypothetical protein
MSLLSFQRALAALAASPELCKQVREDADQALARFPDLTPVERRRLASAAAQPGMRVNCTLYRANRITPVLGILPLSVHLIGKELRTLADAFWDAHPSPGLTNRHELTRFRDFVFQGLDEGTLAIPFLRDVLEMEMLQFELAMLPKATLTARVAADAGAHPDGPVAPHPLVRVAVFGHDPGVLLRLLGTNAPLPYEDVPAGEFHVLVDGRGERRTLAPLDAEWGRLLRAMIHGTAEPDEAQAQALLEAGLAVRTAPASASAGSESESVSEALETAAAA